MQNERCITQLRLVLAHLQETPQDRVLTETRTLRILTKIWPTYAMFAVDIVLAAT
jgi:hypothetical protein